jgi:hypothetical protein
MCKLARLGLIVMVSVLVTALPGQDLTYGQRQAVDRQKRNQAEIQAAVEKLLGDHVEQMKELEGKVVPPAFFKGYLARVETLTKKLEGIGDDLGRNSCPDAHPNVRAILDFVSDVRQRLTSLEAEIRPRLAEAEKIADPANYPNLDADFVQLDELAKAYRLHSFDTHPDKVAELAVEFPEVTRWCSGKFQEYRSLIVVTGGKDSPLYQRYMKTAEAIKGFREKAGEYVAAAQKSVPEALEAARKMAGEAARDKKPAFITGGVQQHLDQARSTLRVCRALLSGDDPRLKEMEERSTAAEQEIEKVRQALHEQIVAETRAPKDRYVGSDRDALRKQVLDAWKEAWPKDGVLGVRFHMKDWDRTAKWTYSRAGESWSLSDRSVLAVTVIVKTGADRAILYPAYLNLDHLAKSIDAGVQTKGSAYVIREMLLANLE